MSFIEMFPSYYESVSLFSSHKANVSFSDCVSYIWTRINWINLERLARISNQKVELHSAPSIVTMQIWKQASLHGSGVDPWSLETQAKTCGALLKFQDLCLPNAVVCVFPIILSHSFKRFFNICKKNVSCDTNCAIELNNSYEYFCEIISRVSGFKLEWSFRFFEL